MTRDEFVRRHLGNLERRLEEIRTRLAEMDYEKHVLVGHARVLEREIAGVRDGARRDRGVGPGLPDGDAGDG